MKIQVGGLSEGLHAYNFSAKPEELGLERDFDEVIAVDATLEKSNGEFLLRAKVAAHATWQCDRCVTDFRHAIAAGYQMYYIWEGADTGRFDPAEIQVIPPGVNMIDLGEDVRQTLLLSVPLKRICREDCKGLCPHCGKNLNEGSCTCKDAEPDSRWDKLKELQNILKHDAR
jgi:uncharacterized protein